ncbi:hypothetical protein GGX14DRAFT_402581 [Mycena pura]|uniref:Uncharacterized protein n=1 Tax=Mycena pura TaxID=153505 RepID=A0AAD6V237_9AGAR|nr:hypothetical protein GGX14DRAFT_402581 [Mycena pura]
MNPPITSHSFNLQKTVAIFELEGLVSELEARLEKNQQQFRKQEEIRRQQITALENELASSKEALATLSKEQRLIIKYVRRMNQEKQEWGAKEISLQSDIRLLQQRNMDLLQCKGAEHFRFQLPHSRAQVQDDGDIIMAAPDAVQSLFHSAAPPISNTISYSNSSPPHARTPLAAGPRCDPFIPASRQDLLLLPSQNTYCQSVSGQSSSQPDAIFHEHSKSLSTPTSSSATSRPKSPRCTPDIPQTPSEKFAGPTRTMNQKVKVQRRPEFRRPREKQNHKSTEEKDTTAQFRKFVQKVLGISQDDEAGQIKDVRTAAEAYAAGRGPAPLDVGDQDFSVHLDVPIQLQVAKHPWNIAVGKLVVKAYLTEHPYADQAFLQQQFKSRLLALARAKSKATRVARQPQLAIENALDARRSYNRIALWQARKNSVRATNVACRRELLHILNLLTSSSMSSDDEDTQDPYKTCVVVDKDWRNPDLVGILKWLDLNGRFWQQGNSDVSMGAVCHPRLRKPRGEAPISTGPVVSGLPVNFYNPLWYQSCDRAKLSAVAAVHLPTEIFTLPVNQEFTTDPNDRDNYWRPSKECI